MTSARLQRDAADLTTLLIRNLKAMILSHGTCEAALARETKIPQPTLHKILSGKTADPRHSTLLALANHFHLTIDELYSTSVPTSSRGQITQTRSVPIISWEDAAHWKKTLTKLNASNWDEWVVTESEEKNLFALPSTRCIESRFPKGTTLIFCPNTKPRDGDVVLALYPKTHSPTIRELSVDGPNKVLIPYSQASEPEKFTKSIELIAVLIQSRFTHHNGN